MSTHFKVEIIRRETITPSSPTPNHLKILHLSLLDQFMHETYPPLVYFYPNHEVDSDQRSSMTRKSSILKASLSKTLTQFYPFAGEFRYNHSIFCNDRGASLIEARVNCRLSQILESPDADKLQCLIPCSVLSTQANAGYLVLAQLNLFECGGIAIALSISHKVADAFTAATFMNKWSAVALGASNATDHLPIREEFGVAAASFYPPQDFLNSSEPAKEFIQRGKCTTRRFVFGAPSIAALKLKAASVSVPDPTRVEVVSALIWKCAMEASRATSFGSTRPSLWGQAVNLRIRPGRTFAENLLGNLVWFFKTKTVEYSETDLQSLVATLRKCKDDYRVKYPNGITAADVCKTIKESDNNMTNEGIDMYGGTGLCGFPFYENDFGWGKPAWVSSCSSGSKNLVALMDAPDGKGIDASLTILEKDMDIVETNQELLAYASLDPSVKFDGFQSHRISLL